MDNLYLAHHGVLGMKWGIRRFQNKDGSRTAAGKKREAQNRQSTTKMSDEELKSYVARKNLEKQYNKLSKEKGKLERSKNVTDEALNATNRLKNSIRENAKSHKERMNLSNMTDKELRDAINREYLEIQYSDLFGTDKNASINNGKRKAAEILDVAGDVLAVTSSAIAIAIALKSLKG